MLSDGVHMVLRVLFDAIADAGRGARNKSPTLLMGRFRGVGFR